jgi:hypothetical protein
VETETYLYKLEVVAVPHGIVQVETGDSVVGDGLFFQLDSVQQGRPMRFRNRHAGVRQSKPVTHLEISGVGEDGPWSYEVF